MNTTMEDVEVMVYLFLFVYGVLCVAISLITGFQNGSFDFCKGVTNVTPPVQSVGAESAYSDVGALKTLLWGNENIPVV